MFEPAHKILILIVVDDQQSLGSDELKQIHNLPGDFAAHIHKV